MKPAFFNLSKLSLKELTLEGIKNVKTLIHRSLETKTQRLWRETQKLLLLHPTDAKLKLKFAILCYQLKQGPLAISNLIEISKDYLEQGLPLKAVSCLREALKMNPCDTELSVRLAEALKQAGLKTEATQSLRVALDLYLKQNHREAVLTLAQEIVTLEPSPENRDELASIYHAHGLNTEAMSQYEILARGAKTNKDFDKLLHYNQLMLPYKENPGETLRDVCILFLRKQQPEKALHVLKMYDSLETYPELVEKAKIMQNIIKKRKS